MDSLRALAEVQHGLVARRQPLALGIEVRRGLRRGEWQRVSARVLRLVGSPSTPKSVLMAAILDAGRRAVASHSSAAALWRMPGFTLLPPHVTRPHDDERHRSTPACLHQTRSLPPHHVTVLDGIPVTTPARTLFDLAGVLPPARTERAVDNALAKSPALLRVLHGMLPELAERGRDGITVMRALLEARPLGYIAPASGLEARAIRILEEAGIRTRRQVDLGGDDWIGRVDLVVVGTNVVVEIDGAAFHTSALDRARDARRDDELAATGYHVVRVPEAEVWTAPDEMVRRVRAAMRLSRAA